MNKNFKKNTKNKSKKSIRNQVFLTILSSSMLALSFSSNLTNLSKTKKASQNKKENTKKQNLFSSSKKVSLLKIFENVDVASAVYKSLVKEKIIESSLTRFDTEVSLNELEQLRNLDLSGLNLSNIKVLLNNSQKIVWKKLENLNLSKNDFANYELIIDQKIFPKLYSLDISNSKLNKVANLSSYATNKESNLRVLNLANNNLKTLPSYFSQLTFSSLNLSNNKLQNFSDSELFSNFSKTKSFLFNSLTNSNLNLNFVADSNFKQPQVNLTNNDFLYQPNLIDKQNQNIDDQTKTSKLITRNLFLNFATFKTFLNTSKNELTSADLFNFKTDAEFKTLTINQKKFSENDSALNTLAVPNNFEVNLKFNNKEINLYVFQDLESNLTNKVYDLAVDTQIADVFANDKNQPFLNSFEPTNILANINKIFNYSTILDSKILDNLTASDLNISKTNNQAKLEFDYVINNQTKKVALEFLNFAPNQLSYLQEKNKEVLDLNKESDLVSLKAAPELISIAKNFGLKVISPSLIANKFFNEFSSFGSENVDIKAFDELNGSIVFKLKPTTVQLKSGLVYDNKIVSNKTFVLEGFEKANLSFLGEVLNQDVFALDFVRANIIANKKTEFDKLIKKLPSQITAQDILAVQGFSSNYSTLTKINFQNATDYIKLDANDATGELVWTLKNEGDDKSLILASNYEVKWKGFKTNSIQLRAKKTVSKELYSSSELNGYNVTFTHTSAKTMAKLVNKNNWGDYLQVSGIENNIDVIIRSVESRDSNTVRITYQLKRDEEISLVKTADITGWENFLGYLQNVKVPYTIDSAQNRVPSQVSTTQGNPFYYAKTIKLILPSNTTISDVSVSDINDQNGTLMLNFKLSGEDDGTSQTSETRSLLIEGLLKTSESVEYQRLNQIIDTFTKSSTIVNPNEYASVFAKSLTDENVSKIVSVNSTNPGSEKFKIIETISNDQTGTLTVKIALNSVVNPLIYSHIKAFTFDRWMKYETDAARTVVEWNLKSAPKSVKASVVSMDNWKNYLIQNVTTTPIAQTYDIVINSVTANDNEGSLTINYKVRIYSTPDKTTHFDGANTTFKVTNFKTNDDEAQQTLVDTNLTFAKKTTAPNPTFASSVTTTNFDDLVTTTGLPAGFNKTIKSLSFNDTNGQLEVIYTINKGTAYSENKLAVATGFTTIEQYLASYVPTFTNPSWAASTRPSDVNARIADLLPKNLAQGVSIVDYSIDNANNSAGTFTLKYKLQKAGIKSAEKTHNFTGFSNELSFFNTGIASVNNTTLEIGKKNLEFDVYPTSLLDTESANVELAVPAFMGPTSLTDLPEPTFSLLGSSSWLGSEDQAVTLKVQFAKWTPEDWKRLFSYLKTIQTIDRVTFNAWLNKITDLIKSGLQARVDAGLSNIRWDNRIYTVRFDDTVSYVNDNILSIGGFAYDTGTYNGINSNEVMSYSSKIISEAAFKKGIIWNLGRHESSLYTKTNNPSVITQRLSDANNTKVLEALNVRGLQANQKLEIYSAITDDETGNLKITYSVVSTLDNKIRSNPKVLIIPKFLSYVEDLNKGTTTFTPKDARNTVFPSAVNLENLATYVTVGTDVSNMTKPGAEVVLLAADQEPFYYDDLAGKITIRYRTKLVVGSGDNAKTYYSSIVKTAEISGFKNKQTTTQETADAAELTFSKKAPERDIYASGLIEKIANAPVLWTPPTTAEELPTPEVSINSISNFNDKKIKLLAVYFPGWSEDDWKKLFSYLNKNPDQRDKWTVAIANKLNPVLGPEKDIAWYNTIAFKGSAAEASALATAQGSNDNLTFERNLTVLGGYFYEEVPQDEHEYNGLTQNRIIKTNNTFDSSSGEGLKNALMRNLGEFSSQIIPNVIDSTTQTTDVFGVKQDPILNAINITGLDANSSLKVVIYDAKANDVTGNLEITYKLVPKDPNVSINYPFKKASIPNFLSYQQDANNATSTWTLKPEANEVLSSTVNSENLTNTTIASNVIENLIHSGGSINITQVSHDAVAGSVTITYTISFTVDSTTYTSSPAKTITLTGYKKASAAEKEALDAKSLTFTKKPDATVNIQASEIIFTNFDTNVANNKAADETVNIILLKGNDATGTLTITYTISKNGITSNTKTTTVSGWYTYQDQVNAHELSFSNKDLAANTLPSFVTKENYTTYLNVLGLYNAFEIQDIRLSNENDSTGTFELNYKVSQTINGVKYLSATKKTAAISNFLTTQQQLNNLNVTFSGKPARETVLASSVTSDNYTTYVTPTIPSGYSLTNLNFVGFDVQGRLQINYSITKSGISQNSEIKTATVEGFKNLQNTLNDFVATFENLPAATKTLPSEVTGQTTANEVVNPGNWNAYLKPTNLLLGFSISDVNITNSQNEAGTFDFNYKVSAQGLKSAEAKTYNATNFQTIIARITAIDVTFSAKPSVAQVTASEVNSANYLNYINVFGLPENASLTDLVFTPANNGTQLSIGYKIQMSGSATKSVQKTTPMFDGFMTQDAANLRDANAIQVSFAKKASVKKDAKASQVTAANQSSYLDNDLPTGYTLNITNVSANNDGGVLTLTYTVTKNGQTSAPKTARVLGWYIEQDAVDKINVSFSNKELARSVLPSEVTGNTIQPNGEQVGNYINSLTVNGLADGFSLTDVKITDPNDSNGTFTISYKVTNNNVTSTKPKTAQILGFQTTNERNSEELQKALANATVSASNAGAAKLPSTLLATIQADFSFQIDSGYELNSISLLENANDETGTIDVSFNIKKTNTELVSTTKTVNVVGFLTTPNDLEAGLATWTKKADAQPILAKAINLENFNTYVNNYTLSGFKTPDAQLSVLITNLSGDNEGNLTIEYTVSATVQNKRLTSNSKTATVSGFQTQDQADFIQKNKLNSVTAAFSKKNPNFDVYPSSLINSAYPDQALTKNLYVFPTTLQDLSAPTLNLISTANWKSDSGQAATVRLQFPNWKPEDWKQLFSYLKTIQTTEPSTFNAWLNKIADLVDAAFNAKIADGVSDLTWANRLYNVRFDEVDGSAGNTLLAIGGYGPDGTSYNGVSPGEVMNRSWKLQSKEGFKKGIIRNLGQYESDLYTDQNNPAKLSSNILATQNQESILGALNVSLSENVEVRIYSAKTNDITGDLTFYYTLYSLDNPNVESDPTSKTIPNFLFYEKDANNTTAKFIHKAGKENSTILPSVVTTENHGEYISQGSVLNNKKTNPTIVVKAVEPDNATGSLTVKYIVRFTVNDVNYDSAQKSYILTGFKNQQTIDKAEIDALTTSWTKKASVQDSVFGSDVNLSNYETMLQHTELPSNVTARIKLLSANNNTGVLTITYQLLKNGQVSNDKVGTINDWYTYQKQVNEAVIQLTNKNTAVSVLPSEVNWEDSSNAKYYTNYFEVNNLPPKATFTVVSTSNINDNNGTIDINYKVVIPSSEGVTQVEGTQKTVNVSGLNTLQKQLDAINATITKKPDPVSANISSVVTAANKTDYLTIEITPGYQIVDYVFEPDVINGNLVVKYKVAKTGNDSPKSVQKSTTISGFKLFQTYLNETTVTFSAKASAANVLANTVNSVNYLDTLNVTGLPNKVSLVELEFSNIDLVTGSLTISYHLAGEGIQSANKKVQNNITGYKTIQNLANEIVPNFVAQSARTTIQPSQVNTQNFKDYFLVTNLDENFELSDLAFTPNNENGNLTFTYKVKYKTADIKSNQKSFGPTTGFLTQTQADTNLVNSSEVIFAKASSVADTELASSVNTTNFEDKIQKVVPASTTFALIANDPLLADDNTGDLTIKYTLTKNNQTSPTKTAVVKNWFTKQNQLNAQTATFTNKVEAAQTLPSAVEGTINGQSGNFTDYLNVTGLAAGYSLINVKILNVNDNAGTFTLQYQVTDNTNISLIPKTANISNFKLLSTFKAAALNEALNQTTIIASPTGATKLPTSLNKAVLTDFNFNIPSGYELNTLNSLASANDLNGTINVEFTIRKSDEPSLVSNPKTIANVSGFLTKNQDLANMSATWTATEAAKNVLPVIVNSTNHNTYLSAQPTYSNNKTSSANLRTSITNYKCDEQGNLLITYKISTTLNDQELNSDLKTTTVSGFKVLNAALDSEKTRLNGLTSNVNFTKKSSEPYYVSSIIPAQFNFDSQIIFLEHFNVAGLNANDNAKLVITKAVANNVNGSVDITYKLRSTAENLSAALSDETTKNVSGFLTYQTDVNNGLATWSLKPNANPNQTAPSTITNTGENSNFSTYINEPTILQVIQTQPSVVINSLTPDDVAGTLTINYTINITDQATDPKTYQGQPKTFVLTGFKNQANATKTEVDAASTTWSKKTGISAQTMASDVNLSNWTTKLSYTDLASGLSVNVKSLTPNDTTGQLDIVYNIVKNNIYSVDKNAQVNSWFTYQNQLNELNADFVLKEAALTTLASTVNPNNYATTLNVLGLVPNVSITDVKIEANNEVAGSYTIKYKLARTVGDTTLKSETEKSAEIFGYQTLQEWLNTQNATVTGLEARTNVLASSVNTTNLSTYVSVTKPDTVNIVDVKLIPNDTTGELTYQYALTKANATGESANIKSVVKQVLVNNFKTSATAKTDEQNRLTELANNVRISAPANANTFYASKNLDLNDLNSIKNNIVLTQEPTAADQAQLVFESVVANDITGQLDINYKVVSTKPEDKNLSSVVKKASLNGYLTYQQDANNATTTFAPTPSTNQVLASEVKATGSDLNFYNYAYVNPFTNLVKKNNATIKFGDLVPNNDNGELTINYKVVVSGDNNSYESSENKTAKLSGFKTNANVVEEQLSKTEISFSKKKNADNTLVAPNDLLASAITVSEGAHSFVTNIQPNYPESPTGLSYELGETNPLSADDNTGVLTIKYHLLKDNKKSALKTTTLSGWYTNQQAINNIASSLTFTNTQLAATTLPSSVKGNQVLADGAISEVNWPTYLTVAGLSDGYSINELVLKNINDAAGTFDFEYNILGKGLISNKVTKSASNFSTTTKSNAAAITTALTNTTATISNEGKKHLASTAIKSSVDYFNFNIPSGYALNEIISYANVDNANGTLDITFNIKSSSDQTVISEPKTVTNISGFKTLATNLQETNASWTTTEAAKNVLASSINQNNQASYLVGPIYTNSEIDPTNLRTNIIKYEPQDDSGEILITYQIAYNELKGAEKTTSVSGFLVSSEANEAEANKLNELVIEINKKAPNFNIYASSLINPNLEVDKINVPPYLKLKQDPSNDNSELISKQLGAADNKKILDNLSISGLSNNTQARVQLYSATSNDADGTLEITYSLISTKPNVFASSQLKKTKVNNFLNYQKDVDNATLEFSVSAVGSGVLPSQVNIENFKTYVNQTNQTNFVNPQTLTAEISNLISNDATGTLNFTYTPKLTINNPDNSVSTYTATNPKTTTVINFNNLEKETKKELNNAFVVFTKKPQADNIFPSQISFTDPNNNFDTYINSLVPENTSLTVSELIPDDKTGNLQIKYYLSKNGIISEQQTKELTGLNNFVKQLENATVSFEPKPAAATTNPSTITVANYKDTLTVVISLTGSQFELKDVAFSDPNDTDGTINITYKLANTAKNPSSENRTGSEQPLTTPAKTVKLDFYQSTRSAALKQAETNTQAAASKSSEQTKGGDSYLPSQLTINPSLFAFTIPTGYELNEISDITKPNNKTGAIEVTFTIKESNQGENALISQPITKLAAGFYTNLKDANAIELELIPKTNLSTTLATSVNEYNYLEYFDVKFSNNKNPISDISLAPDVSEFIGNNNEGKLTINYHIEAGIGEQIQVSDAPKTLEIPGWEILEFNLNLEKVKPENQNPSSSDAAGIKFKDLAQFKLPDPMKAELISAKNFGLKEIIDSNALDTPLFKAYGINKDNLANVVKFEYRDSPEGYVVLDFNLPSVNNSENNLPPQKFKVKVVNLFNYSSSFKYVSENNQILDKYSEDYLQLLKSNNSNILLNILSNLDYGIYKFAPKNNDASPRLVAKQKNQMKVLKTDFKKLENDLYIFDLSKILFTKEQVIFQKGSITAKHSYLDGNWTNTQLVSDKEFIYELKKADSNPATIPILLGTFGVILLLLLIAICYALYRIKEARKNRLKM